MFGRAQVTRILKMTVQPFETMQSLLSILAQRAARQIDGLRDNTPCERSRCAEWV